MSSSNNATYIQSHILRRFDIIKKVGSGAYGHVWKVQQKSTKKIFALKKIFDAFQHATDAQRTYRQIQILKQTNHPNIIKLYDTIKADNTKDVYLVFEFMQADLHNVISENLLKQVHIKYIIYQIAKALKYLHTGFIIHRDLKPSNVLVNSNCSIKLCDFGLVRSISCKNDSTPILTQGVATRWYRAPEVLLGSKSYSTPADIWSVGCIIYEILSQKPLFAGNSTLDQLQKVCQFTGYPTQEDIKSLASEVSKSMLKQIKLHTAGQSAIILKQIPSGFKDLIQRMIIFNPSKRITIQQILNHQVIKAFRKVQQQVSCDKQITTSIDDNKKFTVQEYRKLIYKSASNPQRSASQSLQTNESSIVKSNSAKYLKKPIDLNSSCKQLSSKGQLEKQKDKQGLGKQKQKQTLNKKYSYDNLKVLNKSTNDQKPTSMHVQSNSGNLQGSSQKNKQKHTLKYVRSAKEFLKPTPLYQPSKTTLYDNYKKYIQNKNGNKSTASLGNFGQENKQQSSYQQVNQHKISSNNYMTSSQGSKHSISNNMNKGNINLITKSTYVTNNLSKQFYSPKNYMDTSQNNNSLNSLGNSVKNNLKDNNNNLVQNQKQVSVSAHMTPSISSLTNSINHNSNINDSNNNGIYSSSSSSNLQTNNNWNSKTYLTKDFLNSNKQKDLKDKGYLFKSQKYIRDFKSHTLATNDSLLMKKQEEKGHV